jgi:hypothetical protein
MSLNRKMKNSASRGDISASRAMMQGMSAI